MQSRKLLPLLAGVALATPAQAQLLGRPAPAAGRIVSTKGGEQAQLLPETRLRGAVPRQDLKPGDTLRTNASGTLAVLFADRTQVRLGRNTVLVVKAMANGSPTALRLESGSFWGRAPRGQAKLSVETPSATAAIRGTDWSLEVSGDQTQLQVFDGAIDFFNDQGRLSVTTGQSALARLGQAPARIVTVQSTEREQMQYYFEADSLFDVLSPDVQPSAATRAERARVLAIDPAGRSAEDWLLLAESSVVAHPRAELAAIQRALAAMPLSPAQTARVQLVAAWRAARDRDYAQARALFDQALPGLDGDRAIIARYGRYVAAVRADPAQAATLEPPAAEPERIASWVGQAFLAAYAGDYATARALADETVRRFPDRPEGPMMLAAVALLLDDRDALDAASTEALRRDPEDSDALTMRGHLESGFNNRALEAEALYRRALATRPTDATLLSSLAQVQSDRDANRAAEATFLHAISENPDDPLLRINHAIALMDQNRLGEGRKEIDAALAIDPAFANAMAMRARYALQMGDADAALPDALAGSAADPAGADTLLVLAMLYYRRGDYQVALQQIDAADRLDPAGPTAPLIRAAVALDRLDIDTAILAAREAQRRSVARGGDFQNLSRSSGTGGYIASSFRSIGLDDWGRFYGDRLFDPFDATGYFDRIASGTADPFLATQTPDDSAPDAVSNLVQGLAIEPLAIASPTRYLQLFQEQFVEASIGGGLFAGHDVTRANPSASLQALSLGSIPLAMNLSASMDRQRGPQGALDDRRAISATAILSAELTPYDKVVLFGSLADSRTDLPGETDAPRIDGFVQSNAKQLIALYSHEFGRKSVFTIGGAVAEANARIARSDLLILDPTDPVVSLLQTDIRQRSRTRTITASYAVNLGIVDINIGTGFPGARVRRLDRSILYLPDLVLPLPDELTRGRDLGQRYHLDVRISPSARLVLQGQVASVDSVTGRVVDWRIAAAGQLVENHWLRAGWFQTTGTDGAFTLAPTRAVGLIPNAAPVPDGYRTKTLAVRWDGEWSPHLFTAVDYQRQRFGALAFSLPQLIASPFATYDPPCDFGICSLGYLRPDVDRLSVSGNAWIKGGFGLSASYARTWSSLPDGGDVPFLPRHSARAGLVWQDPSRITARLTATYTGSRRADRGVGRLGDFLSADAELSWQGWDRHLELSASVTNLFDQDYEVMRGVPGFGRTANITATLRF
jgi:tetratricopeptide (TPR) repeat protein